MRKNLSSTLFRTALTVAMSAALAVILPAELFGQNGGVLAATEPWTCNQCTGDEHDHEVTVGADREISSGTFKKAVTVNGGTISGGTFTGKVTVEDGTISGGTYTWQLHVKNGGEISNFTDTSPYGVVSVEAGGKITGGTFNKQVELAGGTIEGGTFDGETHVNSGIIENGTFNQFTYNKGTINGGIFYKHDNSTNIVNYGIINNGTFYGTVLNEASGTVAGGTFHSKVTNKGRITGGTFEGGIDNQGGTVSFSSSTPVVSESTGTSTPVHTHSFEWTVTKEPTKTQDGLEEYKCKSCGAVEASQPISANMFKVKELYGLVKDTPKGGAVAYDFGDLATISDYVLGKMAERNDVVVTVSFTYGGEAHSITFPAGTDYTAVLEDADTMYGFYGVAAKLGITVE